MRASVEAKEESLYSTLMRQLGSAFQVANGGVGCNAYILMWQA